MTSSEDASVFPFVAAGAQGRVRDRAAAEALRVDPATPGHETNEHRLETESVRSARPVTAEGMLVPAFREERFDRREDGIEHFRIESAHDGSDLHWSSGWDSTRDASRAVTTTGGWSCSSPIRAISKFADSEFTPNRPFKAETRVRIPLGVPTERIPSSAPLSGGDPMLRRATGRGGVRERLHRFTTRRRTVLNLSSPPNHRHLARSFRGPLRSIADDRA